MSKSENTNKAEAKFVIPLKAKNVMTTKVAIMKAGASVKKAAEIMAKEGMRHNYYF